MSRLTDQIDDSKFSASLQDKLLWKFGIGAVVLEKNNGTIQGKDTSKGAIYKTKGNSAPININSGDITKLELSTPCAMLLCKL